MKANSTIHNIQFNRLREDNFIWILKVGTPEWKRIQIKELDGSSQKITSYIGDSFQISDVFIHRGDIQPSVIPEFPTNWEIACNFSASLDVESKKRKSNNFVYLSRTPLSLSKDSFSQGFNPDLNKLLEIKKINDKVGWGVFAKKTFKEGERIGEYCGFITNKHKGNLNGSYVFELDDCTDVDASITGNETRFINDPSVFDENFNLIISNDSNCTWDLSDIDRVFVKAKKDIMEGEELTIFYGQDYWKYFKQCKQEKKEKITKKKELKRNPKLLETKKESLFNSEIMKVKNALNSFLQMPGEQESQLSVIKEVLKLLQSKQKEFKTESQEILEIEGRMDVLESIFESDDENK